jgi:hypothetical protein
MPPRNLQEIVVLFFFNFAFLYMYVESKLFIKVENSLIIIHHFKTLSFS